MEYVIIFGVIIGYILPMLVAGYRNHGNTVPIVITTLTLGWTGIIWLGCLIWSFSDNVKKSA